MKYSKNPEYSQIALSNANIIEFYYDVNSPTKDLVFNLKNAKGEYSLNKSLISPTNNILSYDSNYIPKTLQFDDNTSVVVWFKYDKDQGLSPSYQRFDESGNKIGLPINLKSKTNTFFDVNDFPKIQLTPNKEGNSFKLDVIKDISNDAFNNIDESHNVESSYEIKIVSIEAINGSNKFVFDGNTFSSLSLEKNKDYILDWSGAPNHPLKFSLADGTHNGGIDYTDGITVDIENFKTHINVKSDTELFYYCANHSGMGDGIELKLPLIKG